jgi:DNA-binding transcriptional MerR regulator
VADEVLTIAEAARHTGVSAHTLRYYEREGLMLDLVERSGSDHRRYGSQALDWIAFLTKLRSTGMPIRSMREYARLVAAGDGNEERRLELLEAHDATVREQLASMRRNLAAIEGKIALYREAR